MTAVPGGRRYKGGNRCPICNGADQDDRGSEKRCFGFLSEDETHAHCSREEFAGPIPVSNSRTYGHRLAGPCRCGKQHSEGAAALTRPKKVIVKTYDYLDETGDLLYQVVRFEPKAFGQRRPPVEPGGAWIWSLQGVRRVLYRLDRLMEAETVTPVYIPEGEKDVEALESLGLLATCNPQGAEKWHHIADCASLHLAGRHCVVIQDPDDPGRRHGAQVMAHLKDFAASVKLIELPGGMDAAAWVEGGGTAERLAEIPEALAPKAPMLNVKADFARDDKGKIFHTQQNIRLALAKLNVTLRHDEFSHKDHISGLPEAGPIFDALARNRLRLAVDEKWGFRLAKDWWVDVTKNEAWSNRFHPVRDYLAGLKWDGKHRIGSESAGQVGWLTTYGGAKDGPYTRAVGRLILVAACRRVRQPGCKFDEMVILEGEAGKNKSQALDVLATRKEWFCDDLPIASETRDLMEATTGSWICCAEEMAGSRRAGISKLKSYLSRTFDQSRLAYREDSEKVLRQFVLFATSNKLDSYLGDPTGNRKFWPVLIKEFDLEALRCDVPQIWAEAAVAESTGESIRLDPRLYAVARDEQEARYAVDAMDVVVGDVFGDITGIVSTTDAWKILGLMNRTLTVEEQTRFNTAMRRSGWEQSRRRPTRHAKREYCYIKGTEDELMVWLEVEGAGRTAYAKPRQL